MYTNIVVGTDGSATASKAVSSAAALAAIASATLTVVSAYKPVPEERLRSERAGAPADVAYFVNREEDVGRILEDAKRLAEQHGAKKVVTEPVDSGPSEAIIEVAERIGAELIVVGSQGMTGAKRFLLGSVPNRIAHNAGCDVLIVKTDAEPTEGSE